MKQKSAVSEELYQIMLDKGYSERFCDLITQSLNTDFTARRMIGYLSHYSELPEGEVVDEMLAILSDRERIMQKKQLEHSNAVYNEYLNSREG
ncbi:MAG: hypothetical protein LUI14_13650 [Lachnospiraceae bacterium]|nr:hypothetical protein [Lachnospiraceae bacterium]